MNIAPSAALAPASCTIESGQAEPPVTSTLALSPSSFICWSILAVFGASSVMITLSTPAALNFVSCG